MINFETIPQNFCISLKRDDGDIDIGVPEPKMIESKSKEGPIKKVINLNEYNY